MIRLKRIVKVLFTIILFSAMFIGLLRYMRPTQSPLIVSKQQNDDKIKLQNRAASVDTTDPGPGPTAGSVLTLKFTGQQVAGMRGLLSQQCWLNSFKLPMKIVEPFLVESLVIHSKEVWEKEKALTKSLRLSNFYTMSPDEAVLISWGAFINTAPRKVILLAVDHVYGKKCLDFKRSPCKSKISLSRTHTNCTQPKDTKEALEYLGKVGFQVVRQVCLDCAVDLVDSVTPTEIVEYIFGQYKPQEVTLLINLWKFSFQMSPRCVPYKCVDMTQSFKNIQPHLHLVMDANHYTKVIDGIQGTNHGKKKKITVAVMVRLEWFMIEYRHKSLDIVKKCLKNVRKEIHDISRKAHKATTRLLVALDVGTFGSGTLQITRRHHNLTEEYYNKLLSEVKNLVDQLYDGKLTFNKWEESYLNASRGITDRGYIATLQSQLASRADCLVLMGGGNFQQLALQRYLSGHPSRRKCIHPVCIHKAFSRSIHRQLSKV